MSKIRVLLLGAFITLTAGCGGVPLDPARLEVTDALRAACAADGLSDGDILGDLAAIEADRLTGTSYAIERATIATICFDECIICAFAEIDQIYGR